MIIKRTVIDNSIIKELEEKYPAIANNNDVVYKLGLNYLTFEPGFITSPLLRKLIREYGNGVLILIHFLRAKMCEDGWKVRIDDFYLQDLLDDCGHKFFMETEDLNTIYNVLVYNRIFFEVSDTNIIEGVWLTCPQQIYNFEMANNQRKKDRERQSKKRKSKKANTESVTEEVGFHPLDEPYPDYVAYPREEEPFYPTQEMLEQLHRDDDNECF